jgi:hypothetical protein
LKKPPNSALSGPFWHRGRGTLAAITDPAKSFVIPDHPQRAAAATPATVAAYLGAPRARAEGVDDAAALRRDRRAGHDNPAAHAGVKATLAGISPTPGSAALAALGLHSSAVDHGASFQAIADHAAQRKRG